MQQRLLDSLTGYRRGWIRPDAVAALTGWAVLVPESLAYASIAGVSPVVGLYAAPPALVLYAVLGSSRVLVTATTSAAAALSAATVAALATSPDQFLALTEALAIVVGLVAVVAGLLRMGFLTNFVSEPVLRGFVIGMALTIIISQVPKLIGSPTGNGNFFAQTWQLITDVPQAHGPTTILGVACVATILILRRVAPRFPGLLVVMVAGVSLSVLLDLRGKGVPVVGPVASGLPSIALPNAGPTDYALLLGSAIGILLVAFTEGVAAAKNFAGHEDPRIDPNRELVAIGAANIGAGMWGGMAVNGSLSKTAVNHESGARSQVANLIVAVLTLLTLLLFTGFFERLPDAVLAAVVICALIPLLDVRGIIRLWRFTTHQEDTLYGLAARADFIAAAAAVLGVLVFGILPGVAIGIAASVLLLVYRASRPNIAVLGRVSNRDGWFDIRRHADAVQEPGVVVLRPESNLFYANADSVREAVLQHIQADTRAIIIDAESVPIIDITAILMLDDLNARLGERGIRLLIARAVGHVRELLDVAEAGKLEQDLYPTVESAARAVTDPR